MVTELSYAGRRSRVRTHYRQGPNGPVMVKGMSVEGSRRIRSGSRADHHEANRGNGVLALVALVFVVLVVVAVVLA